LHEAPEAAKIAGLSVSTLRAQAQNGAIKYGMGADGIRYTTREWLHSYLIKKVGNKGRRKPLPKDYHAP
jgi:hypothetical protein